MTGRWVLWVVFCWFVLLCTSWTGETGNPVARQSYSFFFKTLSNACSHWPKDQERVNVFTPGTTLFWLPCWLRWERICLQCGKAGLDTWVGKISQKREWLPTLVFWLGESPWTEEPDRLQSTGSQRVGHDWATFTSLYSSQSLQQKKKKKKERKEKVTSPLSQVTTGWTEGVLPSP